MIGECKYWHAIVCVCGATSGYRGLATPLSRDTHQMFLCEACGSKGWMSPGVTAGIQASRALSFIEKLDLTEHGEGRHRESFEPNLGTPSERERLLHQCRQLFERAVTAEAKLEKSVNERDEANGKATLFGHRCDFLEARLVESERREKEARKYAVEASGKLEEQSKQIKHAYAQNYNFASCFVPLVMGGLCRVIGSGAAYLTIDDASTPSKITVSNGAIASPRHQERILTVAIDLQNGSIIADYQGPEGPQRLYGPVAP